MAVHTEAGRALPPLPTPENDVPAELRVPFLASAVYRRWQEPCHVRELLRDPDVRWAVDTLRTGRRGRGAPCHPAPTNAVVRPSGA
ncbi:hypothetical protein ACFT8Q_16260 [Streptomyces griseoincarnatus]